MPYFNIIIPKRYRIPAGATGVRFYDTFDEYISGYFNENYLLNKNIVNFEDKFFTGKVNGYVFYNHFYIFDQFSQYQTGVIQNLSGNFQSGYYLQSNIISGKFNISGVY